MTLICSAALAFVMPGCLPEQPDLAKLEQPTPVLDTGSANPPAAQPLLLNLTDSRAFNVQMQSNDPPENFIALLFLDFGLTTQRVLRRFEVQPAVVTAQPGEIQWNMVVTGSWTVQDVPLGCQRLWLVVARNDYVKIGDNGSASITSPNRVTMDWLVYVAAATDREPKSADNLCIGQRTAP